MFLAIRSTVAVSLVLSSLVFAGCAASDGADDPAAEEDEVQAGAGYRYNCSGTESGIFGSAVMVTLTSRATRATLSVSYADGRQGTFRGVYDSSYAPRTNTSYSRYNGFDLTDHELIVANALRTGAASGALKIQGHGDSFGGSYYYRCHRTTSTAPAEPRAHVPTTFAMPLVGSWNIDWTQVDASGNPTAAPLREVVLRRDGRYSVFVQESDVGRPETGTWTTGAATTYPAVITFRTGTYTWTARIDAPNGALAATRADQHLSLVPAWSQDSRTVCNGSGGAWRREPNPATGASCDCPAGMVFIPSIAGCTN